MPLKAANEADAITPYLLKGTVASRCGSQKGSQGFILEVVICQIKIDWIGIM